MSFAYKLLAPALAGCLGLVGTGLASGTGLAAATARATATPLAKLTAFHQMAVDSAAKYIFFSEGTDSWQLQDGADASSGIVVTSLAGDYVTTLDGGDGVEGIAISPDGATLYAALGAKGKVAAITVSGISGGSPAQSLYALPSGDAPYGVAVQSGKLWVSADRGDVSYVIGDFGLTATNFTPLVNFPGGYAAPDLAADPGGQGLVVGAIPGSDPTLAVTIDAATGKVQAGPTRPWDPMRPAGACPSSSSRSFPGRRRSSPPAASMTPIATAPAAPRISSRRSSRTPRSRARPTPSR